MRFEFTKKNKVFSSSSFLMIVPFLMVAYVGCDEGGGGSSDGFQGKPGIESFDLKVTLEDSEPKVSADGSQIVYKRGTSNGYILNKVTSPIGTQPGTPEQMWQESGWSVLVFDLAQDGTFALLGAKDLTRKSFKLVKVTINNAAESADVSSTEGFTLPENDLSGAALGLSSMDQLFLSPDSTVFALSVLAGTSNGVILGKSGSSIAIKGYKPLGFLPKDSGYQVVLAKDAESSKLYSTSFSEVTEVTEASIVEWNADSPISRIKKLGLRSDLLVGVQEINPLQSQKQNLIPSYGNLPEEEKVFLFPKSDKTTSFGNTGEIINADNTVLGHEQIGFALSQVGTFGIGQTKFFLECKDPQLSRNFSSGGFYTFTNLGENNEWLLPYGDEKFESLAVATDPCASVFDESKMKLLRSIGNFAMNGNATAENYRLVFNAFDDGDSEVFVMDKNAESRVLYRLTNDKND